jgi:hypothetical protein
MPQGPAKSGKARHKAKPKEAPDFSDVNARVSNVRHGPAKRG